MNSGDFYNERAGTAERSRHTGLEAMMINVLTAASLFTAAPGQSIAQEVDREPDHKEVKVGVYELRAGTLRPGDVFDYVSPYVVLSPSEILNRGLLSGELEVINELRKRTHDTSNEWAALMVDTGVGVEVFMIEGKEQAVEISSLVTHLNTYKGLFTSAKVIHTHPESNEDGLKRPITPPSFGDFKVACLFRSTGAAHAVVDSMGVWNYNCDSTTLVEGVFDAIKAMNKAVDRVSRLFDMPQADQLVLQSLVKQFENHLYTHKDIEIGDVTMTLIDIDKRTPGVFTAILPHYEHYVEQIGGLDAKLKKHNETLRLIYVATEQGSNEKMMQTLINEYVQNAAELGVCVSYQPFKR